MRRKDWRIKNLKKDISGNFNKKLKNYNSSSTSILEKKKKSFFLKRRLFLRKLFLRKTRFLIKKNLVLNLFFLKKLLNNFKYKKQLLSENIFIKTNVNKQRIFPEFNIKKNIFQNKVKFKNLIKKELNCVYLNNNLFKNVYGLNYYIVMDKNSENYFLNFKKILLDEENFNLVQLKEIYIEKFDSSLKNEFNFCFNYNLYNLNLIEIYKILIILNLNTILNLNGKLILKYI